MKTRYEYAVIPSAGMYGHGRIKVCSRHKTASAAKKRAEIETRYYREEMAKHGGSSGRFIAVKYEKSTFWADCPPSEIE